MKLDNINACGKEYKIIELIGHGKGGYSYLAENDGQRVVVKQIHHEPCDYYSFGNKIEAEERDYIRLKDSGIRIPKMIDIDKENEVIIKEYIPGNTISELIKCGKDIDEYLVQVREMADTAKRSNLNIDYYPTNFVVCEGIIWYVDYECNEYMEEWDFDHWGIKHWRS